MYDPFKVLGVSPNASDEEIRKAYTELARKYHPDLNPGDREAAKKMDAINNAYDIIRDPAQLARIHEMTKDGKLRSQAKHGSSSNAGPNKSYNDYVQRVYGKTFLICIVVCIIIWIVMKVAHLGPYALPEIALLTGLL